MLISTAADWGGSDGGSRQPAGGNTCCQQDPAGTNQTPGIAGIAVQAAILSQCLAAYLDSHKQSAHGEPLPTLLAGDFNSLWRKIASDAFDEVDVLRRPQQAESQRRHCVDDRNRDAFGVCLCMLHIECTAMLPVCRCHRGLPYTAACTSSWQRVTDACLCCLCCQPATAAVWQTAHT